MSGSSPLTRGKRAYRSGDDTQAGLIPAHAGKTLSTPRSVTRRRAHPRSRGENAERFEAISRGRGSSPLTRGKRGGAGGLPLELGLIPAHAGKTSPSPTASKSSWAHPRSRGENGALIYIPLDCSGSSPLTRGKLPHRGSDRSVGRLIPAHAGKTSARRHPRAADRAHPRSRGENSGCERGSPGEWGSSPLTRGKRRRQRCDRQS